MSAVLVMPDADMLTKDAVLGTSAAVIVTRCASFLETAASFGTTLLDRPAAADSSGATSVHTVPTSAGKGTTSASPVTLLASGVTRCAPFGPFSGVDVASSRETEATWTSYGTRFAESVTTMASFETSWCEARTTRFDVVTPAVGKAGCRAGKVMKDGNVVTDGPESPAPGIDGLRVECVSG